MRAANGETLDLLAGDWRIFQLRAGHRFSTDDLICAWFGAQATPRAQRLLDLGSGVGSVGLLALWCVSYTVDTSGWQKRSAPLPRLTLIEAQEISHRLAYRSVALNNLQDRVDLRLQDIRDAKALHPGEQYDLVTASPPYIPIGSGIASSHPQRAACRMELRGDVFDYCGIASRALAPSGRFSLVFAASDPRPELALVAAGLSLLQRINIVFRRGRPPTIAVFLAAHQGQRAEDQTLVVREADGTWTEDWCRLRRGMGAPDPQRQR